MEENLKKCNEEMRAVLEKYGYELKIVNQIALIKSEKVEVIKEEAK